MGVRRYVSTDEAGVGHAPEGPVRWTLPPRGGAFPAPETTGTTLVLREPAALLDVLDACIFEAEPRAPTTPVGDGAVTAERAQLVRRTPWDTEAAVRFALDCAAHVLEGVGDVDLPGGRSLRGALEDARRALDGGGEGVDHLDHLASLAALRRLLRDQGELREALKVALDENDARDLDALDDPAFDEVRTVADAVLAAVEALRHHLLPGRGRAREDRRAEEEAHLDEEPSTVIHVPAVGITPWGAVGLGWQRVLAYEPAWTAAREAARHARDTAVVRSGGQAEAAAAERRWQAAQLERLLAG